MVTPQKVRKKEPTLILIFGGSGDLAHRKLLPALYNLYLDNYLPDNVFIVGIGRTEYSEASYRAYIRDGIEKFSRRKNGIEAHWKNFSRQIDYIKADLTKPRTYQQVAKLVKDKEKEWGAEVN